MRVREFRCELWLPLTPEELFPFFADAGNLDAITPPWLHFHIVTPRPLEMREGALIDYKLRVRGLPTRWRTLISEWKPPHCFVDQQIRGPYRQWIHRHTFESKDGGTLARDVVHYAVPFDCIAHPLFVRRDIERIFAYRQEALRRRFGGRASRQPPAMQHFFEQIHGWFNSAAIYNLAVEAAGDGDHFVEVGAWKGRSAAFMAVNIANSGKKIRFDVVDTWRGSGEHQSDDSVRNDSLYRQFLENMEPVRRYYTPCRMTSLDAASGYRDGSLSFVFLDASHTYDDVKADILAWLPKIRTGGILAGDDYHHTWPGVVAAVNECVPDHQIIDNVTWFYRKL